jgi:hypothetical protein
VVRGNQVFLVGQPENALATIAEAGVYAAPGVFGIPIAVVD